MLDGRLFTILCPKGVSLTAILLILPLCPQTLLLDNGEETEVVSVLCARLGAKIDVNDLGLKTNYGFMKNILVTSTYNDLMVEVRSERYSFYPY
jgi:hypothetical protein